MKTLFTFTFALASAFCIHAQTTLNYTGSVQIYVVPAGVTSLEITAAGGQGGNGGGLGAQMNGIFAVTPGQNLGVVVGQVGQNSTDPLASGGGGGGSFVYDISTVTLLMAAGGGGGKIIYVGFGSLPIDASSDGTVNQSGNAGVTGSPAGGTGGNGGASYSSSGIVIAGGGAGWLTNGAGGLLGGSTGGTWTGGSPWCVPASGTCGGYGGYGGGGGGGNDYGGGGGGGGYSGGAGNWKHGGGGGSFNSGTSQSNIGGSQTGNGFVTFTPAIICNPTFLNPDVAILPNITSSCPVTPSTPTATNDCPLTYNGTSNVSFPISTVGTTTVTWTYNDGVNVSTQTQNIIISANTSAPVADNGSLPDVIECYSASLPTPTATDDCYGTINGVPNVVFPITTVGTTVVSWSYNDGDGNVSIQNQNVIIQDLIAPSPLISSLPDLMNCASITPSTPIAVDNCAGNLFATTSTTFPITTPGTTVITWTYDDGSGNTSTQTQNAIIQDLTAPVPNANTLSDVIACFSADQPTAPTATDNCAGTIMGTPDVTFPITTVGTTLVTWTYSDGTNSITQTQNITINSVDATATQNGWILTANGLGTYQWIDCTTGLPVPNETSMVFNPATDGNYAVIVTQNSCSDTSACMNVNSNGLSEWNLLSVSIYPNPSNGSFTIDFDGVLEEVLVLDLAGRMVQADVNLENGLIEINEARSGNYIVKIVTSNGVGIRSLVVNN